jgi:hypothetical protein
VSFTSRDEMFESIEALIRTARVRAGASYEDDPFVRIFNGSRHLVRVLELDLGRLETRERALAIINDLDRVRTSKSVLSGDVLLADELDIARILVREGIRRLTHAQTLAHVLDLSSARFLGVFRRGNDPHDIGPSVKRACRKATSLMWKIDDSIQERELADKARTTRPSTFATALAHGAAFVLPPASRGRYRAEFDSELYELAVAGAPQWTQRTYGLRLIDRAWMLRAELHQAAARGKDARS